MLEISESSVIYQAKTELLDLAFDVAGIRNYKKPDAQAKIRKGFNIYKSLQALDYKVYLTQVQRQKIVYCLIEQADINSFPAAPVLGNTTPPTIQYGIQGVPGARGERGEDGGATDFQITNQGTDSIVDSFAVSSAYAARWDYVLVDTTGLNRRSGTITCDWAIDGSNVSDSAELTNSGAGSTATINFSVDYAGGLIRLLATITSGIWTVQGSRYFIPNNGTGTGIINTSLANGNIFVGNASNVATAVTPSGDITISNTGVSAIVTGVIVNTDINATAGIVFSKMATLTASRAAVTNSLGVVTTSTATDTEVGYLSGTTSNIQTQLNGKIGSVTGAITTVVTLDLTASRALVSNPSGKLAISGTTSTEIGYVSGVTSAIQTQINSRIADTGDTMTGALINTTTIEAQGGVRTASSGVYLKTKVINIGIWNMNTATTVTVAHGLSDMLKIRSISIAIQSDNGGIFLLDKVDAATSIEGGVSSISSVNIILRIKTGGIFETSSVFTTASNRGWITIIYEA